jgi:hypothetical protein
MARYSPADDHRLSPVGFLERSLSGLRAGVGMLRVPRDLGRFSVRQGTPATALPCLRDPETIIRSLHLGTPPATPHGSLPCTQHLTNSLLPSAQKLAIVFLM